MTYYIGDTFTKLLVHSRSTLFHVLSHMLCSKTAKDYRPKYELIFLSCLFWISMQNTFCVTSTLLVAQNFSQCHLVSCLVTFCSCCLFFQALAEQLMKKSNKLELLYFPLDANVKDNF